MYSIPEIFTALSDFVRGRDREIEELKRRNAKNKRTAEQLRADGYVLVYRSHEFQNIHDPGETYYDRKEKMLVRYVEDNRVEHWGKADNGGLAW